MKKILVVEDDEGLREGIALALQREDLQFTLCAQLGQALRTFEGVADFDLVLLDLNLPDGSGYELLKTIKRQSDVPVIILTANDWELCYLQIKM